MANFNVKKEKIEHNPSSQFNRRLSMDAVGTSVVAIPEFFGRRTSENPQITIQPKINPNGAVKWEGQVEAYFLNNVIFNKYLWLALVDKKIVSLKGILRLRNIEQRMAAIRFMGIEWLLKESKAELMDKSERGNELYKMNDVFRQTAFFLKYKDISTDRVYFSGVDPSVFEGKPKEEIKADAAMAWKFNWSLMEYNELKIET